MVSVPLRGKYRSEESEKGKDSVCLLQGVSVPLRGKYRSEGAPECRRLLRSPAGAAVSVPLRGKYRSEAIAQNADIIQLDWASFRPLAG